MKDSKKPGGRKLRLGYTTGSCAAAASKAAAFMLLSGKAISTIRLMTPKGIRLDLSLEEIKREKGYVSCAVRKDSGDDPDVTNGSLIFSKVSLRPSPGIGIDGGEGIGRVTKPGLDQPVGEAAINSVPRKMIRENLEEVCRLFDYKGGLDALISCPAGVDLKDRTFNPRLGIRGGISILGTTGIVEPMSEQALLGTIRAELSMKRASGIDPVLLAPGNYGAAFIEKEIGMDPELAVLTSNFIGDTLDMAREAGFREALLIGHIGKLVKTAANMLNTHSKFGDARMEILASHAAACGLSGRGTGEVLSCVSCDEAIRIIHSEGVLQETMASVGERALINLNRRSGALKTEVMIFSGSRGLVYHSPGSFSMLFKIKRNMK